MKKTILTLLFFTSPLMFFGQINYGVELGGGVSKMNLNNRFENWGEFYSGGISVNYIDKNNVIYETGLYYNFRKLRLDRYIIAGYVNEDNTTPIYSFQDNVNYGSMNDLKVPLSVGIITKNGVFSKVNLILQGGVFFSYGLFGSANILYDEGHFWTKTYHIYTGESLSAENPQDANAPNYEYYPLKRFDAGLLFRIGINYNRFSLKINSEYGLVDLQNHYYDYMKSYKLYLSIAYNLSK